MFSSLEEVINYIRKHEIHYVNFCWSDLMGSRRTLTLEGSKVNMDVLDKGFVDPCNKNTAIKPDISTACVDLQCAYPALSIICNSDDTGVRLTAQMAETALSEHGIDNLTVELELRYCIFDDVRYSVDTQNSFYSISSEEGDVASRTEKEYGNQGHRPRNNGGMNISQPVDNLFDLRTETVENMKKVGLNPLSHRHMCGMGQCSISFAPTGLLEGCDLINKAKYVIQGTTASYGKTATFMPKPMHGVSGNGVGISLHLWKDGRNITCSDDEPTSTASHFIGGILSHIGQVMAFTNASYNSYKRFHSEHAPRNLGHKQHNDVMLAPHDGGIYCKFGDCSMNPYFGLAAIITAGIDGMAHRIHPKEGPNPIKRFSDALDVLEQDHEFLVRGGIFTKCQIGRYITRKRKDIEYIESLPHPGEFYLTYSC